MAIFVDHGDDERLQEEVRQTLRAEPSTADDPSQVQTRTAQIKDAVKGSTTFHWGRVFVGLLIGAGLIAAAIAIAIMADAWAAEQAAMAAQNENYEAPESQLPAIATGLLALATAWSGAIVGALFAEAKAE